MRLDRWFKRRYPHGTCSAGENAAQRPSPSRWPSRQGGRAPRGVSVDPRAARCRESRPPGEAPPASPAERQEAEDLEARILHSDDQLLVIDKPPGLAVQGGSKTLRHLDGMLDALRFGGSGAVVHRLDKDTSGVLVLARTAQAATALTAAFASGKVHKLYWAIVVGVPATATGRIEQPLSKRFELSASG